MCVRVCERYEFVCGSYVVVGGTCMWKVRVYERDVLENYEKYEKIREPQGRIHKTRGIVIERARDGYKRGHLAQRGDHREDQDTDEGKSGQCTGRTG